MERTTPFLSEQPTVLALNHVNISFPSVDGKAVRAVEDMSLCIRQHEFVVLIGPSGCGKSTTLNAMAGLIPVDSGELLLYGETVKGVHRNVGYISQTDGLLPWANVLDNVALGLKLRGLSRRARQEKAQALIERMGLRGFEQSYPHELSGGMKKRVAIARVLALDPEILFMDEPFGSLDAFTKEKLQNEVLELWEQSTQTIVYVTHDLTEAIALADRVVLVGARPGRVRREYTVSLKRPRRVMEVKLSTEFVELEKTIWADLSAELNQAEEDR